jgi:hypothetical protein
VDMPPSHLTLTVTHKFFVWCMSLVVLRGMLLSKFVKQCESVGNIR